MTEDTPIPENAMAGVTAAVEQMLAKARPTPPAEYRAHVFETNIVPTLTAWGFKDRFREDQKLTRMQRVIFDRMKGRLKGNGAIVALVGPRGLGKTTLTMQLAIDQAWRNWEESKKVEEPRHFATLRYRKCAKLIARYKPLYADFGSIETPTLEDGIKFLASVDLLIIDEVHDCDDQKMKTRVLTDLIDDRYAALRDTVLIANQTPEDFQNTIGDSILSRLGEHGEILQCEWQSFRTP